MAIDEAPAPTKRRGAVPTPAANIPVTRVQTSYMQVADQLRELIVSGHIGVGQRLPSEAELVPLFGVSRSTVREALRILVTDGLLTTKRGVTGGTFVAEPNTERLEGVLNNAFEVLALTNRATADHFLVAWRAIEVPAAGHAAANRGGERADELDRLSQALPAGSSTPLQLRHSGGFHSTLLAASGNPLLVAMGRPLSAVARARFAGTTPGEDFWPRNTAEHRRIYDAVAAGDVEAAEQATAEHVHSLAELYG